MGKLKSLSSLFSMSDEQAMWRVQAQDDHAAFGRLVQRWEAPIIRLCARMTGDAHQGEDLKQETFARVFARRRDFHADAKFSTWLWRIALNLCYDELRKRQRHGECPLEGDRERGESLGEEASEEPSPDLRLAAQEECALVRGALLRLPEALRAALVLRYCEGLKLREIAEVLEIPETTASSRIAAGLAQITRLLEPQLVEIRGGGS
jgi:RNA polymerase sigma-70 factor (ECF subfamily)